MATGVTWVGHATVLVEVGGLRLLTDPVLARRAGWLKRVTRPPPPHVSERIDAVLLSHLHADHVDLPSLRRVGRSVPCFAPPAVARWLARHGFEHVLQLRAGTVIRSGPVSVEATPAVHDGRRWPVGPPGEAVGYLVSADRAVYFAGDTGLFPELSRLAGRVDVALLPVWGWGPRLGPGHLDPERAAQAAAIIRPRVAIPIHWGTLAPPWARPGADFLVSPGRAFASAARRLAPDVEVRLLEPGGRASVERPQEAQAL